MAIIRWMQAFSGGNKIDVADVFEYELKYIKENLCLEKQAELITNKFSKSLLFMEENKNYFTRNKWGFLFPRNSVKKYFKGDVDSGRAGCRDDIKLKPRSNPNRHAIRHYEAFIHRDTIPIAVIINKIEDRYKEEYNEIVALAQQNNLPILYWVQGVGIIENKK